MNKHCLGLLKPFKTLHCKHDILGTSWDVRIADFDTKIYFPSRGDDKPPEDGPPRSQLDPPSCVKTWRRGNKPDYWGSLYHESQEHFTAELLAAEVNLPKENLDQHTVNFYTAIPKWVRLLDEYVVLMTKNYRCNGGISPYGRQNLELYFDENDGIRIVPNSDPIKISCNGILQSMPLSKSMLKSALQNCSSGTEPRLEYKILLSSYNAYFEGDFRTAVVDAGTALEIALTNKAEMLLQYSQIHFADHILKRFRTLSGRLELATLLKLDFPKSNYDKTIVKIRNDVVHNAVFPSENSALNVLNEVELIMESICPCYTDSEELNYEI